MSRLQTVEAIINMAVMLVLLPAILLHEASHYLAAWAFGAGDRRMGVIHEGWKIRAFGVHYDDDSTTGWQEEVITFAPWAWLLPAFILIQYDGFLHGALALIFIATAFSAISDVLIRLGLADIGDTVDIDTARIWWFIGDGPRMLNQYEGEAEI